MFVGALDDYLASLDLEGLERLDPAIVGEMATVFPALETRSAGMPTAVPDERYRTYRAVRTLLDELARSRPLVVLLDDLHWADPASGELLAHLLAHPPTGSVLVAVAFRPAQIPARLGAALAAAARAGGSARIDLAPLTHRDIFDKLGVSTRAAVAGIVASASSSATE